MNDPIEEALELLDDIKSDYIRAVWSLEKYSDTAKTSKLEKRIEEIETVKNKLRNYE